MSVLAGRNPVVTLGKRWREELSHRFGLSDERKRFRINFSRAQASERSSFRLPKSSSMASSLAPRRSRFRRRSYRRRPARAAFVRRRRFVRRFRVRSRRLGFRRGSRRRRSFGRRRVFVGGSYERTSYSPPEVTFPGTSLGVTNTLFHSVASRHGSSPVECVTSADGFGAITRTPDPASENGWQYGYTCNWSFALDQLPVSRLAPFASRFREYRIWRVRFYVHGHPMGAVFNADLRPLDSFSRTDAYLRGGDIAVMCTRFTGPLQEPIPTPPQHSGRRSYEQLMTRPDRAKRVASRRNVAFGMKPIVFKFRPTVWESRTESRADTGSMEEPAHGSSYYYPKRSPWIRMWVNEYDAEEGWHQRYNMNVRHLGMCMALQDHSYTAATFPHIRIKYYLDVEFRNGRWTDADNAIGPIWSNIPPILM